MNNRVNELRDRIVEAYENTMHMYESYSDCVSQISVEYSVSVELVEHYINCGVKAA